MSHFSASVLRLAAFGALCTTALTACAGNFKLTGPELGPGDRLPPAQVYSGFGCEGGNRSPALQWSGAPSGTRSFAVTVYDPDAPTGSGWWHWVVYNLPADTRGLPEGVEVAAGAALPPGAVQGRNDYGSVGFGGACPPRGDRPHRYVFTVHALKTERLDLPADASPAMVGFMLHTHRLAHASFTARYGR
ncbi:YbhB/YbcL family Raf kinase inhibitor-like protein [Caldimonas brevitalea]|uniref:Phosphatidylethanolamine-binding protein n=1 Tax=Caldimonas brevitalea TaxID=413882 RepID=A0A0G3BCD5_9BURK|nr:YbhB/YbcL family Raf kinase inhibitor-like protein [Caldimonas brevitalea]AKJ27029.1 phosphatidylethanolamine-binding protein [Caldimonas brevitalea]